MSKTTDRSNPPSLWQWLLISVAYAVVAWISTDGWIGFAIFYLALMAFAYFMVQHYMKKQDG